MQQGITLANDRLRVEIEGCGQPGQYAGPRFDWTGFVRQVELLSGGGHTYCVPESLVPGAGTGGIGLCNEFGIDGPPGYYEIESGEKFPKIGIGTLTKLKTGGYSVFESYPIEPVAIDTERGEDWARFRIEAPEVNGYAYEYEKKLSLSGRKLIVEYRLTNRGRKTISTNEYVHNFVAVDGKPIGPGYVLKFPLPVENLPGYEPVERLTKHLRVDGDGLRWEPVTDTFYARYRSAEGPTPFYWELVDETTGAGMRESGSEPLDHYAIWGESHVVSPEAFVAIGLAPGETKSWSRTYEFFSAESES